MKTLRYAQASTPFGRLYVAYRGKAVCCVVLGSDGRSFERACARTFGVRPMSDPRLSEEMATQVLDCLTGGQRFSGLIDLSHLTPFQRSVLQKVRTSLSAKCVHTDGSHRQSARRGLFVQSGRHWPGTRSRC